MTLRIDDDEKFGKMVKCDFCSGWAGAESDDIEAELSAAGWMEYEGQNLCCGCIIRISDIRRREEIRHIVKDEMNKKRYA